MLQGAHAERTRDHAPTDSSEEPEAEDYSYLRLFELDGLKLICVTIGPDAIRLG